MTFAHKITTYAATALVAAAGWWGLLGWDRQKEVGTDGYYYGPYESWQIALLVVIVAGLSVWAGRRGVFIGAAFAIATVLTVSFSIQASADAENDGLWPVGAITLFVGAFAGVALVALATHLVRTRLRPAA